MLPINPTFYTYTDKDQQITKLSKKKIRLIEECVYISIVEKINLITLLLGFKWITDVAIGLQHKEEIETLLRQLELPFAYNHYTHEATKYEWIQVAINQPVLDFVITRRDSLSVVEAGVLYGYPVSAVLAYTGLLKKKWFDKTIAEHYLSGVFSDVSTARERAHFEEMWRAVCESTSVVAAAAQKEFKQLTPPPSVPSDDSPYQD